MQVIKSKNGKQASLGQPTIIKNLEKMFTDDIQTLQSTLTPGTPAFIGQKFANEEDKITEKNKPFINLDWDTIASHKTVQTSHYQCSERIIKSMDGTSKPQL